MLAYLLFPEGQHLLVILRIGAHDGLRDHPAPAQLLVTLTNPAGSEVVVFDGARDEADPGYLELDQVVARFSGDESVNGVWTLRVTDRAGGDTGTLQRWSLTVTSRWD